MNKTLTGQFIKTNFLRLIDVVLSDLGCDPIKVLAAIGHSPATFNNDDLRLPLTDLATILEHCAKATDNPNFSLHLGKKQLFSYSDDLMLLLQTAQTLGDALRKLPKYLHTRAQPILWSYLEEDESVAYNFTLDSNELTTLQRQLFVDLACSRIYHTTQAMTSTKTELVMITMRRAEPVDKAFYCRHFNTPIEFNSVTDTLYFPKKTMLKTLPFSNERLHKILTTRVKQSSYYKEGTTLPQQIRGIITNQLLDNTCCLATVSQAIGCDARTLQRHLRDDYHTSYQAILDEVRINQACLYLKDTNMPLTNIAYALGFSDSSALSRSFRKKIGVPPKKWRTENQKKSIRHNRLLIH